MSNALDLRSMSRREFLRLSSASILSLLAVSPSTFAYAQTLSLAESTANLGRITANNVDMRESPSPDAKLLRTLWQDLVMEITKVTVGSVQPAHNRTWFQLDNQGYVHSGSVQPVRIDLNNPVENIPENGLLAEVTVPFTDAIWNPLFLKRIVAQRLHYSSTHWVVGSLVDNEGKLWYEILEDFYQFRYYVNPAHLRIIQSTEVETLSPNVRPVDKRIEVRLQDQVVIAYEGDQQVQVMRCSAGRETYNGYLTPTGKFTTNYKRPSRHMVSGSPASGYGYDLPGVPWVSYFTEKGVSFHGTFWHNDFGRPRSHGCINLPSEAAKWIYRWTLPFVSVDEEKVTKPEGTSLEII